MLKVVYQALFHNHIILFHHQLEMFHAFEYFFFVNLVESINSHTSCPILKLFDLVTIDTRKCILSQVLKARVD